jgi:hypothetical protein
MHHFKHYPDCRVLCYSGLLSKIFQFGGTKWRHCLVTQHHKRSILQTDAQNHDGILRAVPGPASQLNSLYNCGLLYLNPRIHSHYIPDEYPKHFQYGRTWFHSVPRGFYHFFDTYRTHRSNHGQRHPEYDGVSLHLYPSYTQDILLNRLIKEALCAIQIEKRGKLVSERIFDSTYVLA